MSSTLPLFEDLDPVVLHAADASCPPSLLGRRPADPRAEAGRRAERHLHEARRLARAIRRLPERSPEQTRAGLAICAHLRALLSAADAPSGS
jgi:broad specificity phosphatase PhoE